MRTKVACLTKKTNKQTNKHDARQTPTGEVSTTDLPIFRSKVQGPNDYTTVLTHT